MDNNRKSSLFDLFRIKKMRAEITELREKNAALESAMTPELRDAEALRIRRGKLTEECSSLETVIREKEAAAADLQKEIESKRSEVFTLNDTILMQNFGIYEPTYDFAKSEQYKDKLAQIRDRQKSMVKNGTAATGASGWTINGDGRKGAKMVTDTIKLLLRAYNGECDDAVAKVKYNNIDTMIKRIDTSCDAISRLGKIMDISISSSYKKLKIDELHLALEYQMKKHEESERLKELRAQQREEARVAAELEAQRRKIEKEESHYLKALNDINKQIMESEGEPDPLLLEKKNELESKLGETQKSLAEIDYREANQKAGYVYVISNIGAFGEGVYKIGMTRRLEPEERVSELGDASVPFNFDIHAMIFSDDAPKLEAALHKEFEDRKLNMVNQRREFFRVSLDEIKEVVRKNYDKTVEFVDVPDAEQFRVSEKMRQAQ